MVAELFGYNMTWAEDPELLVLLAYLGNGIITMAVATIVLNYSNVPGTTSILIRGRREASLILLQRSIVEERLG